MSSINISLYNRNIRLALDAGLALNQHHIGSKSRVLLAPAVTVGETEGAMDSASVFLVSSFAYNFVRK